MNVVTVLKELVSVYLDTKVKYALRFVILCFVYENRFGAVEESVLLLV